MSSQLRPEPPVSVRARELTWALEDAREADAVLQNDGEDHDAETYHAATLRYLYARYDLWEFIARLEAR